MANITTFQLSVDSVFTFLVTLLMFSMKIPPKGRLSSVWHNVTFWVYICFWVKTVATAIRIPALAYNWLDADAITMWFNWMGCLTVNISMVVPVHFIWHHLNPLNAFAPMEIKDRFSYCITVVMLYIAALAVTVSMVESDIITLTRAILIWRIFYFSIVSLDLCIMVRCLFLIRSLSENEMIGKRTKGLRIHLLITMYMRLGISLTIVLKFFKVLPKDKLGTIHLLFILTGMMGYHVRLIRGSQSLSGFIKRFFSQHEQILMVDPKEYRMKDDPEAPHLMNTYSQHCHTPELEAYLMTRNDLISEKSPMNGRKTVPRVATTAALPQRHLDTRAIHHAFPIPGDSQSMSLSAHSGPRDTAAITVHPMTENESECDFSEQNNNVTKAKPMSQRRVPSFKGSVEAPRERRRGQLLARLWKVRTSPFSKKVERNRSPRPSLAKLHQEPMHRRVRVLLLGSGDSGKTTIVKQMKMIHNPSISERECHRFTEKVHHNCINGMKQLVEFCGRLGVLDRIQNQEAVSLILRISEVSAINQEIGDAFKKVWFDPVIQAAWLRRHETQILDSLQYFMENIDRIKSVSYSASLRDSLHVRVRSKGAQTVDIDMDGVKLELIDVGGQRNERCKWIHSFEQIDVLIFVAALSEYNQCMFEDNRTNRLMESLTLFQEVCALKFFSTTPILIFLNKNDLFLEKLNRCPINQCQTIDRSVGEDRVSHPWADYKGGSDPELAKKYFIDKFLAKNRVSSRDVFVHITSATNTAAMKSVLEACQNVVLQSSIDASGY